MILKYKTGNLLTGILMSTAACVSAQPTDAAPATAVPARAVPATPVMAPATHPGESATAFPQTLNELGAARLPQLSHAATTSPVGTIIYAINAGRKRPPAPASKARWLPVSTVPATDAPAVDALAPEPDAPLRQVPSAVEVAPLPGKLPVVSAPAPVAPSQDRILLAELQADLRRTQNRLSQADARLSAGQRQLSSFTNSLQQAMLEAGPDAKGLHPFVRVAKSYAGTPYVWGLASRRGFDCSGFIIRVMRDLGYPPLPHSAAIQFNYGKAVASSLLKPGDLVFFKNTYKRGVSHVGIYLGRRRFIHAAGTGLGTIVSSLDEPKWRPGSSSSHYAGARRLIPARG